ncbi:MAG: ClpXP protease specificity-enhancing factor SspB [Thermoanaerobaculia bacterium]
MPAHDIDYPGRVQDALRVLVHDLLEEVAEDGLPGEHHFYLTFRTRADGVEIPPRLAARYPQEMTIVLQHQFEGLGVDEARFGVTLRFDGRPERLVVPFAALTAFADPVAEFALRWPAPGETPAPEPEPSDDDRGPGAEVVSLDAFRKD